MIDFFKVKVKVKGYFIFFILALVTSNSTCLVADSQEPEQEFIIDMELGAEINEVCAGCHGEFAEGGKRGEYPRLAGLPAEYLREQLVLFKKNQRHNIPMKPYANDRELPDNEIYSVTAFIESIQLKTRIPKFKAGTTAYEKLLIAKQVLNIPRVEGDIDLGKKLYNKECKICHGVDAKGKKGSSTPQLSGQYTQYMRKQIIDYNNKKRQHDYDDDDEAFKGYSKEQLQAILAYLSITDD